MTLPTLTPQQNRAAGALLGAFIGDAMGTGPHWYYDLEEQRRDYGDWITYYTTPKPGRYHDGLKAGDSSQSGLILEMTVESLLANQGYSQADFCRRLDEDLFPKLNGTPAFGPGGYTCHSIRDAWRNRVVHKRPWAESASNADTTEAIERALAIAIRYAGAPDRLVEHAEANITLTQYDETVVALSIAYCAVLGLLVSGERFDENISATLMEMADSGVFPFQGDSDLQTHSSPHRTFSGQFSSPDALIMPRWMAAAAGDPAIQIEPAYKISTVYGMSCAIYNLLPTVYYLTARFREDFENAVLHAVNGGGHTQARAMLTGCLVGAQVGLSGIPARFIEGLSDGEKLLTLAVKLAQS